MRRVRGMHFIGIGGVGMGGIAEVMHHLGFEVSGSDLGQNALTERLAGLGVTVYQGHRAEQVEDADVVVISTAVPEDNPELVRARELRLPVVRRAEMLAELMRFQQGIAVAGTHGKTTTTSLVASLLSEGGMDPTYVIGGRLNSSSANAYLGQSDWLVAEADESDASFLHLQPIISIVTNIDADHLSTYDGDFEKLKQTFVDFLMNLPFYGLAIVCIDDEHIRDVLPRIGRPVRSYGFDEAADVRATNVRQQGLRMFFDVRIDDGGDVSSEIRDIELNLPGRHNVLNALAAITVALELGVSVRSSKRALSRFQGIGRRAQAHGSLHFPKGEAELLDDYGHHPTEITATLRAIRGGWPDRRLVVVFQPHRFTRTRDLFDDFAECLSIPDVLILSEVYAAGEERINGADGRSLARAIRNRGAVDPIFVEDIAEVPAVLERVLEDGDIVLTLGAGSVGTLATSLPAAFGRDAAPGRASFEGEGNNDSADDGGDAMSSRATSDEGERRG
ncbi:MAG: UDP-N-acetylmuramate--L-alanine ligase [Gammaproteobacteria bacterium]|nr:MAG: UDP-N-acetylmuramate--L-alanine ligase [Gammaproteobacteria bacterium]PIE35638.1 MAG: UDP-N-acetylmuramate--L-alanine ligase [Gammaproteobacteria bacterium]